MWPENERAFDMFVAIRTQWRVGPGGAYGLDYNVLYRRMDRLNLSPDDWTRLESEIQVMEIAALEVMARK